VQQVSCQFSVYPLPVSSLVAVAARSRVFGSLRASLERGQVSLLGGVLEVAVHGPDVRAVGARQEAVVEGCVLDLGVDTGAARLGDRFVPGDLAGPGVGRDLDPVGGEQAQEGLDGEVPVVIDGRRRRDRHESAPALRTQTARNRG
jgi:hypothetical protein